MIRAGWQPTRRRAMAASLLAAVGIAGCGGSSTVKPAAYVRAVCLALADWSTTVQRAEAGLQGSGAASASRPVAKQDYQRFVASLVTATRRATAGLRAAGTPSVPGGRRIAERLIGAFRRAALGLAKASDQANSIPTDSASSFQAGASAVSSEVKTALEQIANVSPGQDQKLRAAASQEPACQVLTGS